MYLFLRPPSPKTLDAILTRSHGVPFTYPHVGLTREMQMPDPTRTIAGYVIDHNTQRLGRGRDTFDAACAALERWAQFDLGWVRLHRSDAPLSPGTTVGVLAQVFGFYLFNPCRIVSTVREETPDESRFGFAYGTLPGHAARGEERFLITWDRASDVVRYDVLAFSRPALPIAIALYPLVRHLQHRFGRDTKHAMIGASAV